jgi:hypothetical protein
MTKSTHEHSSDHPVANPESEKTKVLFSMSTAEAAEISRWAKEDAVTKSTLLHNMISRERKRRLLQEQHGADIDMNAGYTESTLMGGKIWRGVDLAGTDAGYSRVKEFIDRYPHENWTLSIYNTLDESNAEIDCRVEDIPQIVSFIYNLEHAYPMEFIGENPLTNCYVIGMTLTKGRIQAPGVYSADSGRLRLIH